MDPLAQFRSVPMEALGVGSQSIGCRPSGGVHNAYPSRKDFLEAVLLAVFEHQADDW